MNKLISILLVIFSMNLAACEKSASQLCGGNDPANDLPWLEQRIKVLSTSSSCNSISRSTYKDQTVFIFSNCAPNALSIPILYDCSGSKLELSPGDYQELKFTGNIELIWKSN